MPRRRPWGNLLFMVLFLAVCALPVLAILVPGLDRSADLNEKRELAAPPHLTGRRAADLPAACEAWFNDHFGYRNLLIRLNGLFRYRAFGQSGSPQVLTGREGWLFYDGRGVRGGDPRLNHLAQLPPDHLAMFQALKVQFENNERYFAARGITYLVTIVPDKWSVYGEMLPGSVGMAPARTSGDLFLDYLRAESDLKILDLKTPLRDARWADGPLYHQIDSHWNALGAYVAAGVMARFVADVDARVAPLAPTRPPLVWEPRRHGDLAALMGLEGWLQEEEPRLALPELVTLEVDSLPKAQYAPNANRFPIHTRQDRTDLPRLLILRDSYGDALLPWLSRSFAEVRWVWTSNYKLMNLAPVLDEVQPDIVIEEKAEKYLMFPVRYYTAPGQRAVTSRQGKRK